MTCRTISMGWACYCIVCMQRNRHFQYINFHICEWSVVWLCPHFNSNPIKNIYSPHFFIFVLTLLLLNLYSEDLFDGFVWPLFLHVFLRCLRFRSTTYHKLFIAHSCREQQQKSTHTHTILLWQTVQNINRIFSLCFGQLMTFTAVYIADSIGIDNILVSFFRRMTMNWTAYYVSPFSILREIKPNTN